MKKQSTKRKVNEAPKRTNIARFKADMGKYLRRVRAGEEVTLLNRDQAFAKVIPFAEGEVAIRTRKPLANPDDLKNILDLPPLQVGLADLALEILTEDRKKR